MNGPSSIILTIQLWPKHIRLMCGTICWEHLGERIQNLMGTTNLPTPPPPKPPFNLKGKNLNPLECMLSLLIGRMKIMVLKTVCHHFFWPTQMDRMGSIGFYQCITVLSRRQGHKCRELTTIIPEMGSFTLHKNLL